MRSKVDITLALSMQATMASTCMQARAVEPNSLFASLWTANKKQRSKIDPKDVMVHQMTLAPLRTGIG